MKRVRLRRNDSRLSNASGARKAPQVVLNPSEQQKRAFLVGVEFRSKGRAAKSGSLPITPGAQAARDHATSSSSLPMDSPDFSSEESLDELRTLATSAGVSRENLPSAGTVPSRDPDWQRQVRGNCRRGGFRVG